MCWKILKSVGSVLSVVGVLIVGPTLAFAEKGAPRIQMGEMFFAVPGGELISFPVGETQPKSIMTIQGAETGELTLVIENVGELLHEIRSPGLTSRWTGSTPATRCTVPACASGATRSTSRETAPAPTTSPTGTARPCHWPRGRS